MRCYLLACLSLILAPLAWCQTYSWTVKTTQGYGAASLEVTDYRYSTVAAQSYVTMSYKWSVVPAGASSSYSVTIVCRSTFGQIFSGNATGTTGKKSASGSLTQASTSVKEITWDIDSAHPEYVGYTVIADSGLPSSTFTFWVPKVKRDPTKFFVKLKGGEFGRQFTAYQDGRSLGTIVVGPGDNVTGSFKSWSDSPIEMKYNENVFTRRDDGSYLIFRNGSEVTLGSVGSETTAQDPADIGEPPADGPSDRVPGDSVEVVDGSKVDGALSEGVYTSGVKAIVEAIKSNGTVGGGGGSGGSVTVNVDMTATNAKLDQIFGKLDDREKADKERGDASEAVKDELSNRMASDMSAARNTADEAQSNAQEAVAKFGAVPVVQEPQKSTPQGGYVVVQAHGVNQKMPLNPLLRNDILGDLISDLAQWLRRIIAWGIVLWFFVWCVGRVREMMAAPFATAPFGNSLPEAINSIKIVGSGGGWGYAVRLVGLSILLPVLLTMPLGIVALIQAGLPWEGMRDVMAGGLPDLSSDLGKQAMWYADQFIPWVMCLSSGLWYLIVEYVLFPSQFFWMVFIKIVPI